MKQSRLRRSIIFALTAFSLPASAADLVEFPDCAAANSFIDAHSQDDPVIPQGVVIEGMSYKTQYSFTTFHLPAGNYKFPQNCSFSIPVRIENSDTVLDCNGSVFDGAGIPPRIETFSPTSGPHVWHADAMFIRPLNAKQALQNITIKNCQIRNFGRDGWDFKIKAKHYGGNGILLYARDPLNFPTTNITIESVLVDNIFRDAIYLHEGVNNSAIFNSKISNTGSVGIYLDLNHGNVISQNIFKDNIGREGLAIDASSGNLISKNIFIGNKVGGIFLYRNCGESNGKPRYLHSDYNQIVGNKFIGSPNSNKEQVGIWLAPRQSKDLAFLKCSDAPMVNNYPYYEDYANGNSVNSNTFCLPNVGNVQNTAIRNEGDYNSFHYNFFQNTSDPFQEPLTKRAELLNKPQTGTIADPVLTALPNGFNACAETPPLPFGAECGPVTRDMSVAEPILGFCSKGVATPPTSDGRGGWTWRCYASDNSYKTCKQAGGGM